MNALLGDVFDLYRFRVKALPAYQYPLWQIALLLTAVGVVASAGAPELGSYLPGRIGFCVLYNWLETLLFAGFIGVWLRMARWRLCRPLLSLVVLASGSQLLEPLANWFPDDVGTAVLLLLMFYSLVVLCNALSRVSGVRRTRVVLGVLLFSFLSAFLMQGSWTLASRAGWVDAPAGSWWNPMAAPDKNTSAGKPADQALTGQSGGSSSKDDSSDDDAPL